MCSHDEAIKESYRFNCSNVNRTQFMISYDISASCPQLVSLSSCHGVCSRPLPSRYSEREREREMDKDTWMHRLVGRTGWRRKVRRPHLWQRSEGVIDVPTCVFISSSGAMRAASAAWLANPWTVRHGLAAWALCCSSSAFTMSLGIKGATMGRIGMTTCQNNMMLVA